MKMNQKQYKSLIEDLRSVFEKHNFGSTSIKRKGQKSIEDKIQSRTAYRLFDQLTYGSQELFQEFEETGDYKKLWASRHHNDYRMNFEEFYSILPDRCPITGCLLDYGEGFNKVTSHPCHRPGQDHIIAQNNGGQRYGDINNLQIINQHMNGVKSDGTIIDALQWLRFEVMK